MLNFNAETKEKIIKPLSESEKIGSWLKYDPIYDQIRKNRIEENDGTERHAWEADLKHADWQEVEKLCVEVLSEKSKDLQIISWLLEARQHLYGIKGFKESTEIFLEFAKSFWEDMHPQKSEDADQSFRTHIIEAMLRNIQIILITEPIEELKIFFSPAPSLSKCYEADNFEKLSKRGGEAAIVFQKEIDKGLIAMDRVRNAFNEVNKAFGTAKISLIEECISNLQSTEKIIRDSIGNDAPRFSELISHLNELKGLYKLCSREITPAEENNQKSELNLAEGEIASEESKENADTQKVTDRSGVYQAIRDIAEFLFSLDPHSPSPLILRTIGSWENRNLAEIIADLKNTSPEVKSLFAMLHNACQQDNNQN